jgi:hypothetical protein
MQGTLCLGKAQQQTTRRIFVVRIIFNKHCLHTGLSFFRLADVAFHSAPKSVATELKLA